jgi:predicted permease
MVVVTIALGIGINLGMFCITKRIFLDSLRVPNANSLVYYTMGTDQDIWVKFSDQQFEALRSAVTTNDILGWQPTTFRQLTPSGPILLNGALVTGNTFSVLNLKPYLGRFFGDADDVPGGGKDGWMAVISYLYWKTHPGLVGQAIALNGAAVRVIGVLPRGFTGVEPLDQVDILLPRYFTAGSLKITTFGNGATIVPLWFALSRLPSGVSIQQVQANLKVIESSFRRGSGLVGSFASVLFPNTEAGSLLHVHDGRMGVDLELHSLRGPLILLEILAGAVLLFCCCNLVLLFIGRARRDAHVTAIRLVLGARLTDQARLAMTEAAVLGGIGCLIAIPIAWGTGRGLSLAIQSAPGFRTFPTALPSNLLLLAADGIAVLVACLTGAVASLWLGRKRTSIRLKEVLGSTAVARSRSWIVGVEVFASILLMTAAAMSVVGFQTLSHHSGFEGSSVVIAELQLNTGPPDFELYRTIVNQIRSSVAVQDVATASALPLSSFPPGDEIAQVYSAGAVRELHVLPVSVTLDYFPAIATRILKGRAFTSGDLAGDPVCVLSENVASTLFPNTDPLGRYLNSPACRVVGIAEDAHFRSMSQPPDAVVYELSKHDTQFLIVRAATSGLAIQALRSAIQTAAPGAPNGGLATVDTMEARISKNLRLWRVTTLCGTLCAALAGAILAIGFFGILSLQVAERQREIGVRIALGGNPRDIFVALLKKLGPAVAIGLTLGSAGALIVAAKLVEVYQLTAPSLVIASYLGSLALLGFLMLLAATVPLSRALAVSPVECLSAE